MAFAITIDDTAPKRFDGWIQERIAPLLAQQKTLSEGIDLPWIRGVNFLCVSYVSDEAGVALRVVQVIAGAPFALLQLIVIVLALVIGFIPLIAIIDLVEYLHLPTMLGSLLGLLVALPILAMASVMALMPLPFHGLLRSLAHGESLRTSLLLDVWTSSQPTNLDRRNLRMLRLSLAHVLFGRGWLDRLRHLRRFRLVHGLGYADPSTLEQIAEWMRQRS